MIYADHAATTKMSAEAMAAMVKGWEVYGNPSSLHTIGQEERPHAHYLHSV